MSSIMTITQWQKKQITMLYAFSANDKLKAIHQKLMELITFFDHSIDLSKIQNRDIALQSERWGSRDTSQNWGNNAWQFLIDFQKSLARDIANRTYEVYARTGMHQCARGLQEISTAWLTETEYRQYETLYSELEALCSNVDYTLDKSTFDSQWSDFDFSYTAKQFKINFERIPKTALHCNIRASTGDIPPRTGVYLPLNDPHGSAQFAWVGGDRGKLLNCSTFNDLGLDVFNEVGRNALWLDDNAMFKYATLSKHHGRFDSKMSSGGILHPDLASSAIAREAFISVPREWCFVELIEGEFEVLVDTPATNVWRYNNRVEAGDACTRAGYYFTPVSATSRRHFNAGDMMPDLGSPMGKTIWQWDDTQ